jgi:pSer/pThr/pTyr-binding forkhead associated (FHA) protein
MTAFLQLRRGGRSEMVALDGEMVTIGRHAGCDIVVDSTEKSVSRRHARFESIAGGWGVQDIGSTMGTTVAGQPVIGVRALRDGEEVRLGDYAVVFRSLEPADPDSADTQAGPKPPPLTPRERDVLVALCRPVISSGNTFTEPSTLRAIAEQLVVGEAAVKQHLLRLYDKFDLRAGDGGRRRIQLANEAIRRGSVSVADLS